MAMRERPYTGPGRPQVYRCWPVCWKRCCGCLQEVRREWVWWSAGSWRGGKWTGIRFLYLCRTCAPNHVAAADFFEQHTVLVKGRLCAADTIALPSLPIGGRTGVWDGMGGPG